MKKRKGITLMDALRIEAKKLCAQNSNPSEQDIENFYYLLQTKSNALFNMLDEFKDIVKKTISSPDITPQYGKVTLPSQENRPYIDGESCAVFLEHQISKIGLSTDPYY